MAETSPGGIDRPYYDYLMNQRAAGTLAPDDLKAFNELEAAGEFTAFEPASRATPPAGVSQAPAAHYEQGGLVPPPGTVPLPAASDTFSPTPQARPFFTDLADRALYPELPPGATSGGTYKEVLDRFQAGLPTEGASGFLGGVGRGLETAATGGPALAGAGTESLTGSREAGNVAQGIVATLLAHRLLGRLGVPVPSLRTIGRVGAVGGAGAYGVRQIERLLSERGSVDLGP